MKIFPSSQIKLWDAVTIDAQNISSHELMERAAHACLTWVQHNYSIKKPFYIFCGNGNNGGDGLALTRLLIEENYDAKAVLLNSGGPYSNDAAINLKLLQQYAPQNILHWDESAWHDLSNDAIIVDAIFGTGLNRGLSGAVAGQVQALNKLSNTKISIDIASGLFTDMLCGADDIVFTANYTLSFQTYKRSFLHLESAKFVGKVEVLNIGLSKDFEAQAPTNFYTTDESHIHSIYRPRNPFSHKGTFGTAILVGGSYGKIGAIALSAKAALRSGAGKVFVQAPECGYNILQTFTAEAMFENAGKDFIEKINIVQDAVIGLGPGFGTNDVSVKAIEAFLNNYKRPLVIDADALNIISQNKEKLFSLIPENAVITPHPKEFE
ncbi:MAG TPA: NAD(P)H-hydrate epimerase, partial [Arachidicoccus sp.]